MCKICIFAGTSEGRSLIEALSGRGAAITACVATGGSVTRAAAALASATGREVLPLALASRG